MQKKLLYEVPESRILSIPMQENVCAVSDYEGFPEEEDWDE